MKVLVDSVHPLARVEFDRGEVDAAVPMQRIMLVLQHSDTQGAALQHLLDAQQDSRSPQFRQWLTPQQFAEHFSPAEQDIESVVSWLRSEGFGEIRVNRGHTIIEFSGDVAKVKHAFQTSMHRYQINGATYMANATAAKIPMALAPVIVGLASLNNFPTKSHARPAGRFFRDSTGHIVPVAGSKTGGLNAPVSPFTLSAAGYYGLGPTDLATIYNIAPLWNAATPITGAGQTIAVIGDGDIHPTDFVQFRQMFGLPLGDTSGPTGTQYLNIINAGPDAGFTDIGDEIEADLDTEWASSVAPGATIDYVTGAGTASTGSMDISVEYVIDNNLAPVMNISKDVCELGFDFSGLGAFFNTLYQQAAAQGITVVAPTGDSGSANCDDVVFENGATYGLQVNAIASTPYNVAVGGTDFNLSGGTYFNSSNNATTGASALGYIPETVWNDSCANPKLGTASPFIGETPEQVCNSGNTLATQNGLSAGGGGKSACTVSDGQTAASCSGGYAKPSWQSGTGVPADGLRDIPDVSLFSGDGNNGVFYIYCGGGGSCDLSSDSSFLGAGGTSFASPVFAGIMSLVNQKTGARQGNANYVLYSLANAESGSLATCDASNSSSSSCVFNDITYGSNSVPCNTGSTNCVTSTNGDTYGILSGYAATSGYDLASGLGSVNVTNLVNNWNTAVFNATTTTLGLTSTTITHGAAVTANVGVTSSGGTPTGSYSIIADVAEGAVASGTLTAGAASASISTFPGGTYNVTAHYAGDSIYASSDSAPISLTVTPENSTTTISPIITSPYTHAPSSFTTAQYGEQLTFRMRAAGNSGQGTPTGSFTLMNGSSSMDGGTFPLVGQFTPYVDDSSLTTPAGTYSLVATYNGDTSFNSSSSTPTVLSITQRVTATSVSSTGTTVAPGNSVTLSITADSFATGGTGSRGGALTGSFTVSLGGTTLGTASPTAGTDIYGFQQATASIVVNNSQLTNGANSLTVTYAGDANYTLSTTTISITASRTTSTTALTVPSIVTKGNTVSLSAAITPSAATGTVQFTLDGANLGSPVSISGGIANSSLDTSTLTSGTHSLAAIYSGDTTYGTSTSTAQSLFLQLTQTIIFPQPASPIGYGVVPSETMAATSDSGLPITYTITNGGPATISGAVVSFTGTGTVVIQAAQAGNTNYVSATNVSRTIVIEQGQTISFSTLPTKVANGSSVTLNSSASSGLPVTYSVSGPASLTGSMLSYTGPGTVIVTAMQTGNATYGPAASVAQTITVQQAQTITFPQPTSPVTYGTVTSEALSATSTSGLTVTYSILSGPGSIVGSTLYFNGQGTIVVEADQTGNSTYAAASPVMSSVTVAGQSSTGQSVYTFPSIAIAASETQTVTVSISSNLTLNSTAATAFQVSTQGTPNLDYTLSPTQPATGACTAGAPYLSGQTCTLNITFTPTNAGTRFGAVVVYDNSATPVVVGTIYFKGTGSGPLGVFASGVASTMLSGLNSAFSVATDAANNVYVPDLENNLVKKFLASENYSTAHLVGAGLIIPHVVAIDGAGNVFVSDYGNGRIAKVPVGCAVTTCETFITGISTYATAVDGFGNFYYATISLTANIYELPSGCLSTSCQILVAATNLPNVESLVTDSLGNLYATYLTSGGGPSSVQEFAVGTHAQTSVGPLLVAPYGVAVDGADNLYVAGQGSVYEIPNGCTTSACQITVGVLASTDRGLAVSPSGTVYVSDSNITGVRVIDRSQTAALSFTTTGIGGTSTAQIVGFQNIGTADLTFSSLAATSGFTLAGTACSTSTALSAASACNVSVAFSPTVGGLNSGTVTLTDNSLNASAATQTFSVSGTASGLSTSVSLTASPSTGLTYGHTTQLYAVVTPITYSGTNATGTFTFKDGSTTLCSSVAFDNTGTATCTTPALTGGSHSFTANYSGDATFLTSTSLALPITVSAAAQTITFPQPTSPVAFSTNPISLTATSSSGLAVTYAVTSGPASVSGSTLTFSGEGTVIVTASQAGNANYSAAASVPVTIQVITPQTPYVFPVVTVGTNTSGRATVIFNSTVTLNSNQATAVKMLTYGSATDSHGNALDFNLLGYNPAGTCIAGTTYNSGDACSVYITFAPKYPGQRLGAIVLYDNSATPVAVETEYVSGTGGGAQGVFAPGVKTTAAVSGSPYAVATDGAGNLYFTDSGTKVAYKVPAGCSNSSCYIPLYTGTSLAYGIAAGPDGTVYIADTNSSRIVHIPAGCTTSGCQSFITSVPYPIGVTVDAGGNLYLSNGSDLFKIQPNGTPVNVQANSGAYGVAIGPDGSIYYGVNNFNFFHLQKAAPGCTTFSCLVNVGTFASDVQYVAVDGIGNVYASGTGATGAIVEVPAGCASTSCQINLGTFSYPSGIAVDPSGNVYVVASGNVIKIDRTQSPLSFISTAVGANSAEQSVIFANNGNQPLVITALASANANYTLASDSTCMLGSLAVETSCTVGAEFTPIQAGTGAGAINITDSSLAVTGTVQPIVLSGSASKATTTLTLAPPSPVAPTTGQTTLLTATLSPASVSTTNATGGITFKDGTAAICTAVAFDTNGIATCTTPNLIQGSHSFVASYAGDATFAAITSNTQSITVLTAQTITFPQPASPVAYTPGLGATFSATASSGLSVTYSVTGPATLAGSTVTYTGPGTIMVTASQSGDTTYAAASPVTVTVYVQAASNVTWSPSRSSSYAGPSLDSGVLNAVGSVAGSVTYTYTPSGGSSLPLTTASVLTAGSYTFTANFVPTSTSSYTNSSASIPFTVTNMNIFLVNSGSSISSLYNDGAVQSAAVSGGGAGIAVDASGFVWSLGNTSVAKFTDAGVLSAIYNSVGISGATALALDGAGSFWISNGNGNVLQLSHAGVPQLATGSSATAGAAGVAIDISGNVWLANGANSVNEVIGGAVPVEPLATAVSGGTPTTIP